MSRILDLYPGKFNSLEEIKGNVSLDEWTYFMEHNFHLSEFPLMANVTQHCDYKIIIAQVSCSLHP